MANLCYGFVVLILLCRAYAQVGERCVDQNTRQEGICAVAEECPIVEEQARRGISPTLCGFYQLTRPIVCCETESKTPQPNLHSNGYQWSNANINQNQRPSTNLNSHQRPNTNLNSNQRPSMNLNSNDRTNTNSNSNQRPNTNLDNNERPNIYLTENPIYFPDDEISSKQKFTPNTLRISDQKCKEYSKPLTTVVQATPLVINTELININIEKCDYNSVPLIVGGKPASAGEFPFMAALGYFVDDTISWKCGATLISDRYVLTAAHCTYSRYAGTPTIIRLGDLDFSTNDESEHKDYEVGNIIVHPKYRSPQKYNDIALIQSKTTITFTKYIRPACLYSKPDFEHSRSIATGWGKTDYASDVSEVLLKVSLNIYDNKVCAEAYSANKHSLQHGITSNMICAGELKGGKDTCQGDSGGPLLITQEDNQCKFFIIGVTSFGKACGQVKTPAVYTKVYDYVPWIEQTIW